MTRFDWERMVLASTLRPMVKFVLLALGTRANRANLEAWPSIPTLALDTSLSERAVGPALLEGLNRGFIRRRESSKRKDKRWAHFIYTLTSPNFPADGRNVVPDHPSSDAERSSGATVQQASCNRERDNERDDTLVGPASDADGAERGADGPALDRVLVRHDVPTNIEVQHSLNISKSNTDQLDFFNRTFNSKSEHAKSLSKTMQAVANLEAFKQEILKEPRLQEKSPTEKAAELGLRQREDEGPIAFVQRINEAWDQRQAANT